MSAQRQQGRNRREIPAGGEPAGQVWVEWARPSDVALRMGSMLARSGVTLEHRLRAALTERRLQVTDTVREAVQQRRARANSDRFLPGDDEAAPTLAVQR